jgi:Flp pilus assembly protein CpaB
MRASTLFALTVAVLLGLATAVTLKVTGVFNGPPAPQPVVTPKPPDINVLVSGRSLFKGNLIDAPWVGVRPLRADELKHYEQHKDDYLPATQAAVTFRVAAKNIEADRPLLRSDLEDLAQPSRLSDRLLPNMRAVNVAVLKDESAGGLIQVGEWVDLLLTTQIQSHDGTSILKTAGIAHRLRVVAKRNGLWSIMAPLPEDKPVNYTLEANPYRAAIIEYCKTKGTLALVPVSAADQKNLEAVRNAALTDIDKGVALVSYKAPFPENSLEYQDEDARIEGVIKGEMNIGTSDMARIFSIRTSAPPLANTQIDIISGSVRAKPAVFTPDDKPVITDPAHATAQPAARPVVQDFTFGPPEALPKKCKNCGKKPPSQ